LISSTVPLRLAVRGRDNAEGDIAGAAGHVEKAEARAARRVEARHQRVFPDPVQSARHHVIHDVIAFGDLVKDVIDQACFSPSSTVRKP
jgi:hypothetical protein